MSERKELSRVIHTGSGQEERGRSSLLGRSRPLPSLFLLKMSVTGFYGLSTSAAPLYLLPATQKEKGACLLKVSSDEVFFIVDVHRPQSTGQVFSERSAEWRRKVTFMTVACSIPCWRHHTDTSRLAHVFFSTAHSGMQT